MPARVTNPANMILAVAVAAGFLLVLWPVAPGIDPVVYRAGAILVVAIALWGTHTLPEHVTSLIIMLGAVLLNVAPPAVAFSGFATSGAWLLFSGIVLGLAIHETGLGQRLSDAVLSRFRLTYASAVVGTVAISIALAFVMPATIPRILITLPIIMAIADRMGFEPGSNGRIGMALALVGGALLPTYAILPANLPNIVLVGAMDAIYGVHPTYAQYLLWHFPVFGLLKSVIIVLSILWLFPATAKPVTVTRTSSPMTALQWRLTAVLAVTLGFWMTDFIHHTSPAWVGLTAAIILMLPVTGIVSPALFREKASLAPFFYVGGILSVGLIMAHAGLDKVIANSMIAVLDPQPGNAVLNYGKILGMSFAIGLAMTTPAAPVVLVPMAQEIATATALPLMTVVMTQMVGLATMLFPYQGPPFVIGMSLSGTSLAAALKFTAVNAVTTFLVLAPINYLWWQALGLFD